MKLINAILAFLKQISTDLLDAPQHVLKWADDLLKAPFSYFAAATPSVPRYEPTSKVSDVVADLEHARASHEAVKTLDPSGLDVVRRFCMSPKHVRETTDLGVVADPTVRALLITMDDNELKALAGAGPGPMRKFILGQAHGVQGVPVAGIHVPTPANDVPAREPIDHRLWKIKAALDRGQNSVGFSI